METLLNPRKSIKTKDEMLTVIKNEFGNMGVDIAKKKSLFSKQGDKF